MRSASSSPSTSTCTSDTPSLCPVARPPASFRPAALAGFREYTPLMLGGHARHAHSLSRVAPKRAFGVALVAVSFLIAGCGLVEARSSSASNASDSMNVVGVTMYPIAQRHAAPKLTGQGLTGGSLSLYGLAQGKVVVVNVWASWCGPCREESPMLAKSAKVFAAQNVVFVGVDEQDAQADGRAFALSTGMSYPNFIDRDGALLRKLPMLPQGIPSTVVLDKHSRIAARVIGPLTATTLGLILARLVVER
jgi:thiol-disulfide isomerase/thioredoxin